MPYFIRRDRPDLLERFQIPLDEYLTRCEFMDGLWGTMREFFGGDEPIAGIERSNEYGALHRRQPRDRHRARRARATCATTA